MAEKHCLHVYTGDGKGKTTAAMGMALRFLGHGKRVLIAQFLKDGLSGEMTALRQHPGVLVAETPSVRKFVFHMSDQEREITRREAWACLGDLGEQIQREKPALVVLDEMCCACDAGILSVEDALQLIEGALAVAETVVTGRGAPSALLERADYVTEMVKRRHPFDRGLPARQGAEW